MQTRSPSPSRPAKGPAPDVVVAGAGLIGLACADALARRGLQVELWERGEHLGAERGSASAASAGMLAPLAEVPDDDQFLSVCLAARDLWRRAAPELAERSGLDLDYDDTGALVLDQPSAPVSAFEAAALRRGEPAMRLSAREARDLVPDLAEDAGPFLFLPGEHRVDNRKVLRALHRSAERAGVTVRRGRPLRRILRGPGGLRAGSDHDDTPTGAVLIAAGAWSHDIAGVSPPPVHPVKGQMMRFADVRWPLSGCLRGGHFYAARRLGGGLLLGATVEPGAKFDASVTGDGLAALLGFARAVLPGLLRRPVVETWAGLRPGSPDGRPLLGPIDDGVWVATGHYRNGVLLTPWTAKVLSEWLVESQAPDSAVQELLAPDRCRVVSG